MILKINDRIRNRKVDFFNNFRLNLRYDAVASSFAFDFYYNPDNSEHVDMLCIGHYHLCTLEHSDELLLTGYVLSEAFTSGPVTELAALGGYSLPGVLEDCTIPVSLYPLQSDKLTLREIASKLLKPFGLSMVVDPEVASLMDQVYDTSKANATDSIKSYLTGLTAQKNIVLTHNEKGQLLFTKAKTAQKPLIEFGNIPGTRMSLSFNGQQMHSDITVMKEADMDGGNAGQYTIKNPYVPFVFRPRVVIQNAGDDNSTREAARNILAAELKNMQLTIEIDRWDVNQKLIKPNSIVSVQNPDIYLFKKTNWFVEEVSYTGDQSSMTATLKCVLPEVYNGQLPEYLFKGINLH